MKQRGGKAMVLAKHPRARSERHKKAMGETYFLIRIWDAESAARGPRHDWTGCGDTEAQAWNDAADRLGLFANAQTEEK